MKIFLDNCIKHIVVQRMLPYWAKFGVSWSTSCLDDCDVQLSFISISTTTKLPLALRLDGIYYDSDTPYKKRNLRISEAHGKADLIIYQSKYCRAMCERYLRKRKKEAIKGVIYNGIGRMWCGKPIEHKGTNIVVSARWRRHKRLKEIIEVFLLCKEKYRDLSLHVLGDLVENEKVRKPGISYYGHIDWDGPQQAIMENVYRMADISIHLSMKDCCPNSVVEAIGAGIPVLTTSACGGGVELSNSFGSRMVIEPEPPDPCPHYSDKYNELDKKVRQDLVDVLGQMIEKKDRVKQPRELTAEFMARSYLNALSQIVRRK